MDSWTQGQEHGHGHMEIDKWTQGDRQIDTWR